MKRGFSLEFMVLIVMMAIGISVTGHFIPAAHCATISGQFVIPDSDMGFKPQVYDMKIRVEGTEVSADVVPIDQFTADFTLTGVPSGQITVLLIERSDQDVFTHSSKRAEVNITGDTITGVSFNLSYHWKGLAGYPSPWGTNGYGEWTPHFVSDQVGFILFRVRGEGINPERMELYRTTNDGLAWSEIGHWEFNQTAWDGHAPYPSLDRSFHFSDQDHGVVFAAQNCLPCGGCGSGVFYTADGGQHWDFAPLPLAPLNAYAIGISRFAQINPNHLIGLGSVGCHVQGYSLDFYDAIWESIDAGATWELKASWNPAIGGSALGANADGKAIAYLTPYWGGAGVGRSVAKRDVSGNWTKEDDNSIATNSGYGPADLPMVGDTAWVTNAGPGQLATLPAGLYRSNDAGLNWTKISDALLQYMDFATANKGFGIAGSSYITYDGGVTWFYQSAGDGWCCHGNNIWAFDTTHAIWHGGGPNVPMQLFTYVEPWEANFEVLAGVKLRNGYALKGDTNVPVASYKFLSHGPVPLHLKKIKLHAFGIGDEMASIGTVKVWWDKNGNGSVDGDDLLIDSSSYSGDDGVITFSDGTGHLIEQFNPSYFLVTYDFSHGAYDWDTFSCFINPEEIEAETADAHTPLSPTVPLGHQLPGRRITVPLAFNDIPTEHWAKDYVYALEESRISGGCGAPGFCPDDPVTRGQMAVFIETSLGVLSAPVCFGYVFLDVNENVMSPAFCGYIERLAADGITGGCGGRNYCPNEHITRAEMAVFIEAALGNSANFCTGRFADVPDWNPFCGFVERLGRRRGHGRVYGNDFLSRRPCDPRRDGGLSGGRATPADALIFKCFPFARRETIWAFCGIHYHFARR